MSSVGDRIKELRQSKGYSAEDLGRLIGKDRATIYRYEAADYAKTPLYLIEQIARVLDTTPAYLMGWEEPAPSPEPEIQLMSRAMYAMTPEERTKLIEIGKVMFREAFRDDQKP